MQNDLDSITNANNKEHNEKWPYIPDHLYRIIIIGGSRSGKTNALLNLINDKDDIDKIYCMQEIWADQSMNIWLKLVKMQD